MKICVLIPSFNEEKTIGWLVGELRKMELDVLVVDDGSTDNTESLARQNGAQVLKNEHNLGKGASLRKAFIYLSKSEYDALIVMDGDGQHLPKDIEIFMSCYNEKRPAIIVGNRMQNSKGMPFVRWVTNSFMSLLISCICRRVIPDTQCGFRMIDINALNSFNLTTENFEIESEMLLEASRKGFLIESVPITTVYSGQLSAINPIKDTIRFFRFIFRKK